MAAPTATNDTGLISLRELIDFISHVADCYPDITKDFPQQLIDMLSQHHLVLEPELREKVVGSLVLLRKKDLLDSATCVENYSIGCVIGLSLIFGQLQASSYNVPNTHHHAK